MSTTPNETLVDSLADLLLSWTGESREAARTFVEEHRLVSLPERPNGFAGEMEVQARLVGYDSGGHPEFEPEPLYQHFIGQVGGMPDAGTPVYIILGEPIDVEEGEP
jgi:hypothetical protein